MWLLVVVGAIVDQLLKYAAATIGITMPITFLIACVVAIWIICNEIISILENIKDIGAPVPPFLLPLLKNLKSQVEEVAKTEENVMQKRFIHGTLEGDSAESVITSL